MKIKKLLRFVQMTLDRYQKTTSSGDKSLKVLFPKTRNQLPWSKKYETYLIRFKEDTNISFGPKHL